MMFGCYVDCRFSREEILPAGMGSAVITLSEMAVMMRCHLINQILFLVWECSCRNNQCMLGLTPSKGHVRLFFSFTASKRINTSSLNLEMISIALPTKNTLSMNARSSNGYCDTSSSSSSPGSCIWNSSSTSSLSRRLLL